MTAPIRIGMTSTVMGRGWAALAAAHVARARGVDFFFFRPTDVDRASETIDGHFFEDGRWVRRRTDFPDVVDNSTMEALTSEPWRTLSRRARITTPYLGGKLAVDRVLRASGQFDRILIPTVAAESPDHIVDLLDRYGRIVVKPDYGGKGRGIVYAAKEGHRFILNLDFGDRQCTLAELRSLFAEPLERESHIVQQYVASRTATGQPFDVRIHVRRDGLGQWRGVYIVARIGTAAGITSNFATGGSLTEGQAFLKYRFAPDGDAVWARVLQLSKQFPPAFQALYPGTTIPALGLDLGFDDEGNPLLFEVNSNPSPQFTPFCDDMWRVDYAIYLAKHPDVPDGVNRDL